MGARAQAVNGRLASLADGPPPAGPPAKPETRRSSAGEVGHGGVEAVEGSRSVTGTPAAFNCCRKVTNTA